MFNCGSISLGAGEQFIFNVICMTHSELNNFQGEKSQTVLPSKGRNVIALVGNYRNRLNVDEVRDSVQRNMTLGFIINDMIPDPWDFGKDECWIILV